MRAFRLVIVGLLIFAACSPAWYYPHLDWLLPWYVRDYISLAPDQQSELENRLGRQLDWHCRTQLPAYAAFLRSVGRDFANPEHVVSLEQFQAYYGMLHVFWKELLASIAPDVADLLISASDRQIEDLFQAIEVDNQELEEKYVDPLPEEIYRNRYERMTKRMTEWIGPLEDRQKSAVEEWSNQLGTYGAARIANRRAVQQQFRKLLAGRTRNPAFKSQFTALLTAPEMLYGESYRIGAAHRTTLTLELLARTADSLTDEQRRHLLDYLAGLADDFDRLACPATPEIPTDKGGGPR